ncbi:hypothetical protein [Clostridium sp.]|uniref:MurR/RpiR family transcriptional regulator n=1 Tax=Clostridium sp. TaxID=1506 RepID=UPI0026301C21|nr:hypothetical protein [Clostridium sp.]
MNIFFKLNKLTNLTENKKILVKYIQDNTEIFVKMSASEISEACFVSTSTIYRLCQKLDLSGLSELKVQASSSINEYLIESSSLDYNYPFKQNETEHEIVLKMIVCILNFLNWTIKEMYTINLTLIKNSLIIYSYY